MATYRRVYDSFHLQADCQEPGSAPEPYTQQSSMGYLVYLLSLPSAVQYAVVNLVCISHKVFYLQYVYRR